MNRGPASRAARGVRWAMLLSLVLGGCSKTLVFGERDGVNLAIRANTSSPPPVEVNFGLDRVIATIVPPAAETSGGPSGEAVNMLAGFQVERFGALDPHKPIGIDLQIASQFASGAAAKKVAADPALVAKIVDVSGVTFVRDRAFRDSFDWQKTTAATLKSLDDKQIVALANLMAPKLNERDANTQTFVGGVRPPSGRFGPMSARNFLQAWVTSETATPKFEAEWADAIATAKQAGR